MKNISVGFYMYLGMALAMVFSSGSQAQEFQAFDMADDNSLDLSELYPAWSVGVGAGLASHSNEFSRAESPTFSFQFDGRIKTSRKTHLRGIFRRQSLKSLPHRCWDLQEGCDFQYDAKINQYHVLLGWHTSVGNSQNHWVNIELGPALLHWQPEEGRSGDTSGAFSLNLVYLWALSDHLSFDTGLNALVLVEDTKVGSPGGANLGLTIGLNYH